MNFLETLARRLAIPAVALPGLALAQAGAPAQQSPPGALSGAWPLGLIVLLVGLMAIWGTLVARRGRHSASGPDRRGL